MRAPATPGSIVDLPFAPGGEGLRTVLSFRRDPLGTLARAAEAAGDHFRFRATSRVWVAVLRSPEAIKHVLVDHPARYTKQSRGYKKLREFLGQGLLTSEGEFWRRQRRIAQPAFHRDRVAGFATTMVAATQAMLRRWEPLAARGQAVDVDQEMMRLTLQIAGETLLSADVDRDADRVGEAVSTLNEHASHTMMRLLAPPIWVPTPRNRRALAAARHLDRIVLGILAERRRTGEDRGDLLSMLMRAVDEETGARMSDAQLRDEVLTIFLAGHETTANALTWTLYLLSKAPTIADRVHAELTAALAGRAPTVDDLPRLPLVERVIKESLRLYPAAWSIGRFTADEDAVVGYRVPARSIVLISPWLAHRNPAHWPNPEGFDPDRFLPERERERPRHAYLPFSTGPRVCIGNVFAMMEARLCLATILQRFRPALVGGAKVEPAPLITLRPRGGVRMTLDRPPG
ncbi:MAG: cytochrome P450 [Nannocystaceae bacterium]